MNDRKFDEQQLELFLDDQLSQEERDVFLADFGDHPKVREQLAIQQQIDDGLRSIFQFESSDIVNENDLVQRIQSTEPTAPNISRRNWYALAAMILISVVAGLLWLNSNNGPNPVFQERSLASIYQDAIRRGFTPYYICDDPERFAEEFRRRQGRALALAKMPDNMKMLGISYLGGLSRQTTAMLCDVDGHSVIVFVDKAEFDSKRFRNESAEGLTIRRTENDGLVFYEVAPIPGTQMTEQFEFLD